MPVMQPAEIWQESGRWDAIGGEMFRLKDRKGADMALAMTHEEVVTWLAAREVHSYKQLPQLWYHFQTKERDEARPKSGILRTREFIMKDSYSLDVERRGAAGELPAAHRRLRPHLRALRHRLHDGRGRLGHDGRRHQPRVHGLRRRRRGRDRLLPRVRLRLQRRDGASPAPTPSRRRASSSRTARRTRRSPGPPARRSTCWPRPSSTRRTARPSSRSRPTSGCRRAPSSRRSWWCRGRGEAGDGRRSRRLRPGHGPRPRRPRARRAQAAQGARRRVPHGHAPTRCSRPRASSPASSAPCRRRCPCSPTRRCAWATTSPAPTRPASTAAASRLEQVPQATFTDLRDARPGDPCPQCAGELEGARVIEVGNIFQLGLKYSGAHGRDVPGRGRQGAPHRHGQLRHRPRAHRRRRRRAAPRRQRHLLAGEHRPVPRAPRARARLGRGADGRSPTTCTRSSARRAARGRSTTTAT